MAIRHEGYSGTGIQNSAFLMLIPIVIPYCGNDLENLENLNSCFLSSFLLSLRCRWNCFSREIGFTSFWSK